MMTTTLSLYDALGEDQLQGINAQRTKLIKQWEMLLLAGSLVDFPVDSSPLWAQVEQVV